MQTSFFKNMISKKQNVPSLLCQAKQFPPCKCRLPPWAWALYVIIETLWGMGFLASYGGKTQTLPNFFNLIYN